MTYRPPRRVARFRSAVWLEQAMRTANLSGAEIAREVGISRQFVSRLRKGRAHGLQVERAEALERVLGCKPGRLFEYPGEAEQERAAS